MGGRARRHLSGAPRVRRFAGQVALVTGAASGIGAACARLLAREDAFVYCADLDLAGARDVAREIGKRRALPVALDVTSEDDWTALLEAVHRTHPHLTALVHAAGISAASPLTRTTLDEWRRVLAVNLDGAFLATRHGIADMAQQGGAIVVIGSASGIQPAPGAAAYSTSKAAVAMLVRAAAKECRADGVPVRVNAVSPGGVKTPMWRSMSFFQDLVAEHGSEEEAFTALAGAGPAFATPEEIAEVVLFLLSPAAAQVTGVEVAADGGYVL